MDLKVTALSIVVLAVVILFLTLASKWSMAFLILFGMISIVVVAAVKKMKPEQGLPVSDPAPAAVDRFPAIAAIFCCGRKRRGKPESSTTSSTSSLSSGSSGLSTTSSSSSELSTISSSSSEFKYDVYLNFRGQDTREGFTSFLYQHLKNAGIRVFIDEEYLTKEYVPKIDEAIKQSRISIAIFSENYASSKWCLIELEQMWECRKANGQIIIPIFYHVSPADVKNVADNFGKSFNLHYIDRVNPRTIQKWREVLGQIGTLAGYELNQNSYDAELIEKVTADVVRLLTRPDQVEPPTN